MVRVYYWRPKTWFGVACAAIATLAIFVGLLFMLLSPNFANVGASYDGRVDACAVALLAAVVVGTFLGATLERPRVLRAHAAKELLSSNRARNQSPSLRFGPNSGEVDGLFARLRIASPATWDALAAAHEAALVTPWAARYAQVIENTLAGSAARAELGEWKIYLERAEAEAIRVALDPSFAEPSDAQPSRSVVQARANAAVAMALLLTVRPHIYQAAPAWLWRPFEAAVPFAVVTQSRQPLTR